MQQRKQQHTVVGVFTDHTQAERAVHELKKAGFTNEQIGVAGRDWRGEGHADQGSHAGEGALAGAVAGAGVGGLVGLGVLAGIIPVIGPAIAAGTLGVILSNAAAGAAVLGLVGAMVGMGIPEEEAKYYEDEFKAGRYVVTVQANGRAAEAEAILRRHGGYDFHHRPATTAATTATPMTAGATTAAAARPMPASRETTAAGGQKIQLTEEELRARKEQVTTGEVRVHKEVVTEHKTLDVPVQREEVVIERKPVHGQPASGSIQPGQEIRIPIKEEQVRVEKQPVVKEEVDISKRTVQETEHVGGTVRKEELKVEETGGAKVTDPKNPKKNNGGRRK